MGSNPVAFAAFLVPFLRDPLGFVQRRFETYGPTYFTVSRGAPLFVTRDLIMAKDVLIRCAKDFEKRTEDLEGVLGQGLVTSNGELWRRQRRMIQPAFQRRAIDGYVRTFRRRAIEWCEHRREGEVIDLNKEMTRLTLEIVGETLFGFEVRGQTKRIGALMDAVQNGTNVVIPSWVPTPGRIGLWLGLPLLNRMIAELVAEKRRRSGDDLLSALIEATDEQGAMSDQQLRDEVVTLFAAGHDTTALALTWALFFTSRRPEALDGELSGERIDALIDETLRLRPPAYAVTRRAIRDTEAGGWKIKAGDEIVIWIHHLHREGLTDPEAFLPERWLGGEAPEAYMPFGAGQRACIGVHFARFEARTILEELLARWRFTPTDNAPVGLRTRITLAPSRPIKVRLHRALS